MRSYTQQIVHVLEKITASGAGQSQIFDDFLEIVHDNLTRLPEQIASVKRTGQMAQDLPQVIKRMKVLRARYNHESYFDLFDQAFAILLASAEEDWSDTIGEVYMEFGHPSTWAGQFFTPYPLAKMMARMTASDIPGQVHERIKAVIKTDALAQSILMTGTLLEGKAAENWYFEKLIPAVAPNVKQVTVNDCSCGSGVMFLAAASEIPRWMLDWGFVQFYGQDTDQTCVHMAQINMMLHGLNGYSMKCAVAMGETQTPDTAENLIEITREIFGQHPAEMEA
jgi:type I restriction-modification system DNA methylase subunit